MAGAPILFVSSTVDDLRPYRAAAEQAGKMAGFSVEMMEYFGASGRPSLVECRARVSRADVLVVICAHRYGWIPEDQEPPGGQSITWLECEQAVADEIEIHPFIVDPNADWSTGRDEDRIQATLAQDMDAAAAEALLAEVRRDVQGLRSFKAWLSERPRATFASPEDLKSKVLQALYNWRERHPEFPPVSGPVSPSRLDREALRTYLKLLGSRTRHVSLRGIDVGASDAAGAPKRIELSNVYIGLKTTTTRFAVLDDFATERPAPARKRPVRTNITALDATIDLRHLVLLGDPGSGKSTFVNHLALCLAQHAIEPSEGWAARLPGWPMDELCVPLVVTLRDVALAIGDESRPPGPSSLWRFIERELDRDNLRGAAGALERTLEDGHAIVLLDGLDEVTGADRRAFVHQAVSSFIERYPKCRYLITCRTLAYQDLDAQLPGISPFVLAPFDSDQINAFIDTWYDELGRLQIVPTARARDLAHALRTAVRDDELASLASNPLLLTVMALVHAHKGTLPDARAQLYEDTVDLLLYRWEEVKTAGSEVGALRLLLAEAGCKDVDLKQVLWALAFQAHRDGAAADTRNALADIAEHRLLKALANLHPSKSHDWAQKLVDVIKSRAGLLIERAPEVFTLPHRTFQEYLAGAYLASHANFATEAVALFAKAPHWRTAILLGVGRLTYVNGEVDRPLTLAAALSPSRTPTTADDWRRVWLAGSVLEEMGVARAGRNDLGQDLLQRVPQRLAELVSAGQLTVVERAEAGTTLGRLGDPRFAADRWYLPDDDLLGFIEVAAGPFTMGSDSAADPDARVEEKPQHRVDVAEYYVARYSVTVAQFRAFAEHATVPMTEPRSLGGVPNHPVVHVSWHEAIAYGRWLTERLRESPSTPSPLAALLRKGWEITLPSEAEWEKAARGTDARRYPWGDTLVRANVNGWWPTGVGATTAVGLFPGGASPYGALDMSGNVWEWTRSLWSHYPYEKRVAERERASDADLRTARGGAFGFEATALRSACRLTLGPTVTNRNVGFRVVLTRVRPR